MDMDDGTEEDFKFMNETGVDEPEQFSNDTLLNYEKDDNETMNSGDFTTINFSGAEQPEEKRSLTSEDDSVMDPQSGSTTLDTGSANIEEASSGIRELPTGDFLNNEEKEGSTDEAQEDEAGGTDEEEGTDGSK